MSRLPSRTRRLAVSAALLTTAALLIAGCSTGGGNQGGGDAAPTKGGNITVRIAQDPGSLDSVASDNAGTTYITRHIFEGLVIVDANFTPQPDLAKSWTKSDDGLTYTFPLRKGVVFSDGTPLTSADVVASLNDWVQNNGYAASLAAALDSISAPDDATVVVKLKSPMNVVALMANSSGSQVHKASLVKDKPKTGIPNDKVIGTGPYKLKSWTPGQEIVLERNDKYQAPEGKASGYAGAQGAYLNTITWKVVGDNDAALNALQSGQLDVAAPPNSQYDQVKANKKLSTGKQASGNIYYASLNHNAGTIFASADARDAMNMVIDKNKIMEAQGVPDLIGPSNGAFAAETNKAMYSDAGKAKWLLHDAAKAKDLFAKAGLKPGQKIRMITTDEFPEFKDALVQIQQDLKSIGIDSTIDSYDFGTLMDRKNNQKDSWDVLALMDDANPPVPDYTDNVMGLNNSGYPRDQLAPLVLAYNKATDAASQKTALDAIQKFTSDNLPTVTLYRGNSFVAFNPKLKGYAGWALYFANAWLSK